MSEVRLLLTCGLPGAGKTTLARRLAAERRALRLTQDEWLIALGSTPWDATMREKLDRELWRLAQDALRLGVSVVVDFGLWARIEARNSEPPWSNYPIGRPEFDEWVGAFEAPDGEELAMFDPAPGAS